MEEGSKIRKIAFVGDHLPRKCGIATFTSDLLAAVATAHPQSQCFSVSVNDIKGGYDYPEVVRFEIEEQDISSYLRAADFLNISNVDLVCLQHEFGIFGGPAGGHVLAFLRELKMPVVTTLHTVLREPRADQRRVMQELISLSTRVVVMTERGRQMLHDVYDAPPAKIDLIAHGIPDVGFVDPTYFKDQFGVEGKVVLLTFGLLSPNKGIEYVLKALPQILAEFPDVVYIVLGATHPNELREHGEAYRVSLEILAKKNKIEKNVIFYNDFVDLENLKEFIGAADLYITPYLNEAQITSGTLAYTFGAGKAVVSTPYWHAAELLADDRGVLVPFADADAIAREVIGLRRDDPERVRGEATTCAAFLNHAFDAKAKRFHNHMSFDRRWLDDKGSEDCHGRALWALGIGVGRSPWRSFQMMAGQLFALALPALTEFTSPRAWALGLIGIHEYLRRLSGDSLVNQTRGTLTSRLMELFERTAQPDWCWFEEELTYDNAKLPHALILSGRATGQPAVFERGLQSLRWLTELQISEKGHFRSIGSNGFYRRGGIRANFDQQLIEAQAMVSACLDAYRATSDLWWYEQAQRAFDWFIGWNDLGLELCSPKTGGCRDGLHVDRVNRNQGAESTLAFLLSLAEMRLAQNMLTSFKEPIAA